MICAGNKNPDSPYAIPYHRVYLPHLKIDVNFFTQEFEEISTSKGDPLKNYQSIYLELPERQRELLNKMYRSVDYDEELIRKYFSLIDLEEFRIREKLL